jgi:hypothetical protein
MLSRIAWRKPDRSELLTLSVILLVAANLVPLYGVLFLKWQVFPILLVFWMENIVIGVFNVFKMLLASPTVPTSWLAKIFIIPFFCFHYGMFTLVHGIFVFVLFGGVFSHGASFPSAGSVIEAVGDFQLGWALLALLLSHAVSFSVNYVGKGEYKQASLQQLMGQPYSRVVLLHITILFGGFIVMALGSPVYALLLLILLKTLIDVQAHLLEHRKYRSGKAQDPVIIGIPGRST